MTLEEPGAVPLIRQQVTLATGELTLGRAQQQTDQQQSERHSLKDQI